MIFRTVLFLSMAFILNSCATILSSRKQKVRIITPPEIKLQSVNLQYDSSHVFIVKREDIPLKIRVKMNGFETGCEVPAHISPLVFLNLVSNYGIGMVIDFFNNNAYRFPKKIYLYEDEGNVNWSKWKPIHKKDLVIGFVPFTGIVDWQIFSTDQFTNSFTSHTTGEFSVSKYLSKQTYLQMGFGSSKPISDNETGALDYINLKKHWITQRFDFGTGIMGIANFFKNYSGNRFNMLNYGTPHVGLAFSAAWRITRFSKLELLYQQAFINMLQLQPSYVSLISLRLNFGIKMGKNNPL